MNDWDGGKVGLAIIPRMIMSVVWRDNNKANSFVAERDPSYHVFRKLEIEKSDEMPKRNLWPKQNRKSVLGNRSRWRAAKELRTYSSPSSPTTDYDDDDDVNKNTTSAASVTLARSTRGTWNVVGE